MLKLVTSEFIGATNHFFFFQKLLCMFVKNVKSHIKGEKMKLKIFVFCLQTKYNKLIFDQTLIALI